MKLEKLSEAMLAVTKGFNITATDVLLLNDIMSMRREKGAATIMELAGKTKVASSATVHKSVKKLVARRLLTKVTNETNQRYKALEPGSQYDALVELLKDI